MWRGLLYNAATLKGARVDPLGTIIGNYRIEAPLATREQLARAHSPGQIASIFDQAPAGDEEVRIDPDTVMSAGSLQAALRAAGAVCAAVDGALDARHSRAFCAVRPPGHHATHAQAMGFCLFNNVAVGAAQALARGIERVAIVDFDVHHGNGTQAIFQAEPRIAYLSSHQSGLYPHSGSVHERGAGNLHNALLPPGSGGFRFRNTWIDSLLPALDAFRPQLVLVSAGFDAHRDDPLGGMLVTTDGFATMCAAVRRIADKHAGGRLGLFLEGGYNLKALSSSVLACVRELESSSAGAEIPVQQAGGDRATREAIDVICEAHRAAWPAIAASQHENRPSN